MKKCMIVPVFLLLLIVGVFAVTVVATDIPETHSDSEAKTVTVTLYNKFAATKTTQTYTMSANKKQVYEELPLLSEYGYIFEGWYTDPDEGIRVDSTTQVEPSDHTLYAHWRVRHGNITWSLQENGLLTLSGNGDMEDYSMGTMGNNPPWYKRRDSIKTVQIQAGITSISMLAFVDCNNLTSVVIPDTVSSIGDSAFSQCSSLMSVTIPDSVINIGHFAFNKCEKLSDISMGKGIEDIGNSVFNECSSLVNIVFSEKIANIGNGMFASCRSLTDIILPNSIFHIGDRAFVNCDNLRNITIGNNVSKIGDNAFNKCSSLTSITIPDSVTTIEFDAFKGCSALTSITIGNGVTSLVGFDFPSYQFLKSVLLGNSLISIGNNAFNGCDGLTNITIPNSVITIGDEAFKDCSGLTNITIPDSVVNIGYRAFSNCNALTNITTGNGITSLKGFSFSEYNQLNTVTIGKGIISIEDRAFQDCSNLKSVIIPDSVTNIGSNAFSNCSALADIIIPDSVTSIGADAFNGCSALTSILISENITSIGKGAFAGCDGLTNITVPSNIVNIEDSMFQNCRNLTSITLSDGITSVKYRAFSGCQNLTDITIPESVTNIGMYAFVGCSALPHITIPNGVISIGEGAFSGCSALTDITIPDSVTSIGKSAFAGCNAVESIIIGNGVTNLQGFGAADYRQSFSFSNYEKLTSVVIGNSIINMGLYTFQGCSNLQSVVIGNSVTGIGTSVFSRCSSLTSISIPESVKSLSNWAFSGCINLTNLTIPASVTDIAYDAFKDCSNLRDVFYTGTEADWNAVSGHNQIPSSPTVHYLAEPFPNSEKLGITQENNQWTVTAGGDITVTVQLLDGSDFDASRVLWSNTGVGIAEITDKGQKDANSAYAVLRGLVPGKTTLTATLTAPLGSSDMRSVSTSQEITVVASGDIWFPTSASRYVVASGQTIDIYAYIDNLPTGDANKVAWETGDSGNAFVVKKESSGPIFSSPVLVSARLTGYVAGETSLTVTAPDGRSASIPVLVTNSKAAQNVIVTPTASGSLNAEDAPPETPTVSWLWDKDSGLLEIKGSGAIHDYASYDETPWASYRNEIKTVKLYDGVTGVGKNAFRNCMALQEVTIPKTLVSVSENAFAGDSKLKKANFDGTPEEWKTLVSNMASGNEPLKNLKREQLNAYHSQERIPVNSAYNTVQYEKTWLDLRNEKWNTLKSSIDSYMSEAKDEANGKSKELDRKQRENQKKKRDDKIESFQKLSAVKSVGESIDIGLMGEFLTFDPDDKKDPVCAIKWAAYEMLYDTLESGMNQCYEDFSLGEIDLEKGKIGKIDISETLITVQIINNVGKYLKENLQANKIAERKTATGVTVELWYGRAGTMGYYLRISGTVRSLPHDGTLVPLALPDSSIEDMTKQFLEELCAQERKMLQSVVIEYLKCLDDVTGFTDAFTDMAKNDAKKVMNGIFETLGLVDKWNLSENAYKINEIYKELKSVIEADEVPSPEALNKVGENIRKIKGLSTDDIVDDESEALVDSINNNLEDFITDVLLTPEKSWTDVVDDWTKKVVEAAKEKYQLVTDVWEWAFHKDQIDCPVDFRIYDVNGACVGYVENGAVWYNDAILIEVNGECKTVYIPNEMEVRYEFTGTGNGTMTYVMEEVRNGVTVGRKNYYDIPLTEGASYTQTFTTGSDLTSLQTNPVVSADGSSISANEYLDAQDESLDASVYVDCIAEGAGAVTGFGNFPKGNAVSLFACPEDGMEFVGWSENGVLVSADSLYQFAARENRELHAVFRKPYEENDEYEISVNDEYPYSVGVAVYQDENALAHIAITPLSSQDTTDLSQVKAKRYRLDGTIYAEQTLDAAYDLKYSYWLPATDVSECAKLELFDKSEQLIAVLFSEEWDAENPPTLSYRNLQRSADRVSLTAEISNPSSADVSGQIIVAAYNSDGKMLNCSIISDVSLTTNSEAEKSAEITCQGNGNTATVKLFFLDDAWVPLASALAVT